MALPLFVGVGFALDPEPLPEGQFTTWQIAATLGLLFLVLMAGVLLLGYLLLRRSRLGWLLAVVAGVLSTGGPGAGDAPLLDVLGRLLSLATWLPLLIPQSLRWFWKRRTVSDFDYVRVPEIRRPD